MRLSTGLPATPEKKAEAMQVVDAVKTKIEKDGHPSKQIHTFAEACDRYLKRPGMVGATQRLSVLRLRKVLGRSHVHTLGQKEIEDFIAKYMPGVKSQSARRVVIAYSAVLNYAADSLGWRPPVRIRKPKDGEGRDRFLTPVERELLLSKMSGGTKALTQFLLYTGCRIGEALKLRWQDVMPDAVIFESRKGKGAVRRKRRVPLHAKAKEALEEVVALYGLQQQCFGGIDIEVFRKEFKAGCDAAGIMDFVPHDCRHTFASILVAKGVSLRAVADLLGHTSLAMVMRYAHLSPSVHKASVELL